MQEHAPNLEIHYHLLPDHQRKRPKPRTGRALRITTEMSARVGSLLTLSLGALLWSECSRFCNNHAKDDGEQVHHCWDKRY